MGTDSTIDSEDFTLVMGRFGPPSVRPDQLLGGILGAAHHNVAAAFFPVGSVVVLQNRATAAGGQGLEGQSEFVYIKATDADDNNAIAAKSAMVPDSATAAWDYTNDPDGSIGGVSGNPRGVYALSAMTANYYGFAWCGGVVPEDSVIGMAGNFRTDGGVSAAVNLQFEDLSTSAIGLGLIGTSGVCVGFSMAADA